MGLCRTEPAQARSLSSWLLQLPISTVATALPVKFAAARASLMNRSIPTIRPTPSSSSGRNDCRPPANAAKPAPLTPAAPLDAMIMKTSNEICSPPAIGLLIASAIMLLRPSCEGLSATEVAEVVGTSRVTARRYLPYLADSARVVPALALRLRHKARSRVPLGRLLSTPGPPDLGHKLEHDPPDRHAGGQCPHLNEIPASTWTPLGTHRATPRRLPARAPTRKTPLLISPSWCAEPPSAMPGPVPRPLPVPTRRLSSLRSPSRRSLSLSKRRPHPRLVPRCACHPHGFWSRAAPWPPC